MTNDDALDHLFRMDVASDLELLAALHDREIDRDGLMTLAAVGFPNCLALNAPGRAGSSWSPDRVAALVAALAADTDPALLEELAAGYAEIYLLHGLGASPTESPWVDDDGLQRQEPMLKIRRWFRKHQLTIADGTKRPDDHIAYALMFAAHLLRTCPGDEGLAETHAFLSRHPQRWFGDFARRIENRGGPPFYCALAAITADYIDALVAALAPYESVGAQMFQPTLPQLPTFGLPCSPGHAP